MKKALLSLLFLLVIVLGAYSQTTSYCHTFNNSTGVSEYDPNDRVTYSVSGNELTIIFTNAVLWASNEVKIDFPSLLDLSGASSTNIVSFEAKVSGSVAVTGGGCDAGINYVPFGLSFYDNGGNYTPGFSTPTSVYAATYSPFTGTISGYGPASNTSIQGISIKPADPGGNCTSGTSVVNATIIIRNLKINGGTCGAVATPTSYCGTFASTSGLSEYDPNDHITYSVASNELTVTFSNAVVYGSNEVKIDFPTALDLSGASTTGLVSFDVKVSSAISATGGGCGASINYVPLAFNLYDNSGGTYGTDFSTATSIYDETQYVHFSVNGSISGTNFDNTSVQGIAFKPGDPGSGCTSGTSVINGEMKIKNFAVNSSSCGTSTAVKNANALEITKSVVFPNPSSDLITLEMTLRTTSALKVTLSDAMGKTVMTLAEGNFADFSNQFSVANLNKGIYTVNYYVNGAAAKAELLMIK